MIGKKMFLAMAIALLTLLPFVVNAQTSPPETPKKTEVFKNWTKEEVVIIFIDYQPEVLGHVYSKSPELLMHNTEFLAKTAKAYHIPVILSTVGVKMGAHSPTIASLKSILRDDKEIDRSSMNSWDSKEFVDAVKATGKKKLVFAGIWTEVCLAFPVIDALNAGYEVSFITDAVGGTTKETHDTAVSRLIQAGAIPNSTLAFLAEISPDWSNPDKKEFRPLIGEYFIGLEKIRERSFAEN